MAAARIFSMPSKRAAAGALSLVLATGMAWAQGAGTSPAGGGSGASGGGAASSAASGSTSAAAASVAASDRSFMTRAAASGLFEVEAARMAADKAQDEAVKRYASMLVEHHTAANQELMSLAQSKGVNLPATVPGSKRRELDKLQKASADRFDAEFVRQVGLKAHREDVKLFREASRRAEDPALKAWAAKTLPTLEKHLSEAQALPMAQRPTGSGGGRDGSSNGPGGSSSRGS